MCAQRSTVRVQYTCDKEQREYSLFALLKSSLQGAYAFPVIQITITVPSQQNVEIIDDLLAHGFCETEVILEVKKDATAWYSKKMLAVGADPVNSKLTIRCQEEHATANAVFCCKGTEEEKVFIITRQEHGARKTKSDVMIKAVLDDASMVKSNSLIFVEPGAHEVEASQASKNIMLSESARAVAIPQLEVLADDVSCKHGAAMSMLDEDALFYLQSRGLSEHVSKQMIIDSFLQ